jgi:hypothetical protein
VKVDGPVRVEDEKDGLDRWVAYAQIATAITVPLLLLELFASRLEGRRERTRNFQEHYLGREFQTSASLSIAFFRIADTEDCVEKVRAWARRSYVGDPCLPRTPGAPDDVPRAAALDIAEVLGFFEDFGTAYMRRDLSRKVVKASFRGPPVQVFVVAWWYICWRRDGKFSGETDLYLQFEKAVKKLRKGHARLQAFTPTPKVGLLCLPADVEGASDGTWERSRRLSNALNVLADDRLDAARDRVLDLTGTADRERRVRWSAVVVPSTIYVEDQPVHWRVTRERAEAIARHLSRLDPARTDEAIEAIEALAAQRAV